MEPYGVRVNCLKCGVLFESKMPYVEYVDLFLAGSLHEWLNCTCSKCGYTWRMKCADNPEED